MPLYPYFACRLLLTLTSLAIFLHVQSTTASQNHRRHSNFHIRLQKREIRNSDEAKKKWLGDKFVNVLHAIDDTSFANSYKRHLDCVPLGEGIIKTTVREGCASSKVQIICKRFDENPDCATRRGPLPYPCLTRSSGDSDEERRVMCNRDFVHLVVDPYLERKSHDTCPSCPLLFSTSVHFCAKAKQYRRLLHTFSGLFRDPKLKYAEQPVVSLVAYLARRYLELTKEIHNALLNIPPDFSGGEKGWEEICSFATHDRRPGSISGMTPSPTNGRTDKIYTVPK